MVNGRSTFVQMIGLISAADLAAEWGYAGTNDAFRAFCAKLGIRPVPGRIGWYDPHHVRHRMDAVQGIDMPVAKAADRLSLVEQRKARNATP